MRCDSVDGQQWTDGLQRYSDDGRHSLSHEETSQDLVAFVGLLPVSHPAGADIATAVAGGASEDPGRIIYDLEERLKAANATISNQSADIARLQAEWQTEFTAAQQLRSEGDRLQTEVERLERELAEYHAGWSKALSASAERSAENERLQAEIERLQTELQQSEARDTADDEAAEYAARLEGLLDNSREALRDLQEDHTAMGHHCEGMKAAFLAVIKTLWEIRR